MTKKLKNVEEVEFDQFYVDENEINKLKKRGQIYPDDETIAHNLATVE
jgi:hypothetical protein